MEDASDLNVDVSSWDEAKKLSTLALIETTGPLPAAGVDAVTLFAQQLAELFLSGEIPPEKLNDRSLNCFRRCMRL